MSESALSEVAKKYRLTAEQFEQILHFLRQGYNIPYLMRYQKGLTAGLKPKEFYDLIEERRRLDRLAKRRSKILKRLRKQDVLTKELEQNIKEASTMREMMDYYVPYRPRRRSASRQALAQGLGSFAQRILDQEEFIEDMAEEAKSAVDPEKGLESVEEVLQGVGAILCDWMAEEKTHRDRQRKVLRKGARLRCQRQGKNVPGRLAREFKQYFDYNEPVDDAHPYHMLRMKRGERLNVVKHHIQPPLDAMHLDAAELYLTGGAEQYRNVMRGLPDSLASLSGSDIAELNSEELLCLCIDKSIDEILSPILCRELDKELSKEAESLGLDIMRRELRSLLMTKPFPESRVLGVKSGFRTGCKLAVLDEEGQVVTQEVVHPHTPLHRRDAAKEKIAELIDEHDISLIAIGDGTASDETELLMSEVIQEECPDAQYSIVSEAGLEAYTKGEPGKKEFGDLKPGQRAAVSIGRRLKDPLAELVKIDPVEICSSPYVDDVPPGMLREMLDHLVEHCLCSVGINLNECSDLVLRCLTGVDEEVSTAITEHRNQNGGFDTREELCDVSEVGYKLFRKIAGFLKVPNGDNPLDRTRINPPYYPVAQRICEQVDISVDQVGTEEGKEQIDKKRSEIELSELEKQFDVHYLLLKDIVNELRAPWPDPREDERAPILRKRRLTFEDLEPGQEVTGTVRNVVDFGVFVDIGVGEDGLIHISELADHYVESPFDLISVGDQVRATVVDVDRDKRRIALSMRSEPELKRDKKGGKKAKETGEKEEKREKGKRAASSGRKPSGGVRQPQSTVGWQSRRVQKAKLDKLSKTDEQLLQTSKSQQNSQQPDEEEAEEQREEREESGSLLDKLDFADVERRGEDRSH